MLQNPVRLALALALLLASCGTAPPAGPTFDERLASLRIAAEGDTLPAYPEGAVARVGDRVDAHVLAETADGVVERLVEFEVVGAFPEFDLGTADVQLATGVRGADGEPLAHFSAVSMRGRAQAARTGVVRVRTRDTDGTLLAERHVGGQLLVGFASMVPLAQGAHHQAGLHLAFNLVLLVPELDDLLLSVARRPPLWSLLGGVELELQFVEEPATRLPDGTVRAKALILADGHIALEGRVDLGPKRGPYLLSGGILALEGHHPEREDRRAVVRVVRVEAGEGPYLFDGDAGPFLPRDAQGCVSTRLPPNGGFRMEMTGRID